MTMGESSHPRFGLNGRLCGARVRLVPLLGLAILAAACATPRDPYLFEGNEEHLDALADAARACGLHVEHRLRLPESTTVIAIERTRGSDPRLACIARWIRQNPHTGFQAPNATGL